MTIHDDIDNYLAADLHSELSDEERNALHGHLVECADCRRIHQETKTMSKAFEEKFIEEKPGREFENRMLAHFRNHAPNRRGTVTTFILDLWRFRAVQFAGLAALLLALVQIGRMITGDGMVSRFGLEENESQFSKRDSDIARSGTLRAKTAGDFADRTLSSSGGFAPPPASAAAESNNKADVTRLSVRAPTDMLKKLPEATGGLGRQMRQGGQLES